MWKCICMAVALWGCTGVLQAKVVLPSVFTDNMVLQQKNGYHVLWRCNKE